MLWLYVCVCCSEGGPLCSSGRQQSQLWKDLEYKRHVEMMVNRFISQLLGFQFLVVEKTLISDSSYFVSLILHWSCARLLLTAVVGSWYRAGECNSPNTYTSSQSFSWKGFSCTRCRNGSLQQENLAFPHLHSILGAGSSQHSCFDMLNLFC